MSHVCIASKKGFGIRARGGGGVTMLIRCKKNMLGQAGLANQKAGRSALNMTGLANQKCSGPWKPGSSRRLCWCGVLGKSEEGFWEFGMGRG
jgi:hypothetical protein